MFFVDFRKPFSYLIRNLRRSVNLTKLIDNFAQLRALIVKSVHDRARRFLPGLEGGAYWISLLVNRVNPVSYVRVGLQHGRRDGDDGTSFNLLRRAIFCIHCLTNTRLLNNSNGGLAVLHAQADGRTFYQPAEALFLLQFLLFLQLSEIEARCVIL